MKKKKVCERKREEKKNEFFEGGTKNKIKKIFFLKNFSFNGFFLVDQMGNG